jgi:hypothetical protein
MSSTGKSSGYLYRCSEGAESFSVTLARPVRAEVRQETGLLGLQNAITYRETGAASRILLDVFGSGRMSGNQNGHDPDLRRARRTFHAQNVRSKVRYCIASAMCLGSMAAAPSRSATVRATFRMRSWARAVSPCWFMARSRSRSQSADSSQKVRMWREVI